MVDRNRGIALGCHTCWGPVSLVGHGFQLGAVSCNLEAEGRRLVRDGALETILPLERTTSTPSLVHFSENRVEVEWAQRGELFVTGSVRAT